MYDILVKYNQDNNVYSFRHNLTLTYERSNNFLLFNLKESLIVINPQHIHYANILQAEYFR